VDFLRGTLAVAETCAEVEGRVMFADVKTPASRRTLALPPFLVELLAAHLAAGGRPGPEELVFAAPEGGPLRRTLFRTRVFDPAKRAAGLDKSVTFHGLRHSAVGLMIEVGAHIEAIKQRLGHSSIRTTSDVYGSLLPTVDAAVTDQLNALFVSRRDMSAAQSTHRSSRDVTSAQAPSEAPLQLRLDRVD
jgi:integrase